MQEMQAQREVNERIVTLIAEHGVKQENTHKLVKGVMRVMRMWMDWWEAGYKKWARRSPKTACRWDSEQAEAA